MYLCALYNIVYSHKICGRYGKVMIITRKQIYVKERWRFNNHHVLYILHYISSFVVYISIYTTGFLTKGTRRTFTQCSAADVYKREEIWKIVFYYFIFPHHSRTITRPRGPPASSGFVRIMFQPHTPTYMTKGVIYMQHYYMFRGVSPP